MTLLSKRITRKKESKDWHLLCGTIHVSHMYTEICNYHLYHKIVIEVVFERYELGAIVGVVSRWSRQMNGWTTRLD